MRDSAALAGVLLLMSAAAPVAGAEAPVIAVGVAQVDITPSGPIRLSGYAARKTEATETEQRLRARALAIGEKPDETVLLITVDNCGVPARMTEEIAARLNAKAGLARERLVIGSTHTHSAPLLSGTLPMLFGAPLPPDQQERIDRYTREVTDKLEQVALSALADRRPGRLAWARGKVDFAANRRVVKDDHWTGFGTNPSGPVDHTMPLLRVTDAQGQLRAVLIGYACHCTSLGGEFNKVCGDWAGFACEAIERDHPGAIAMVLLGCGADSNPFPRGEVRLARAHGESVAREASRLLDGPWTSLPGTIVARFERIELPFGPLPTRDEWVKRTQKPDTAGWHARLFLERLDRGETLPSSVPLPVQSWCFGDELAMVFLGGEVVVDYALRLEQELDPERLWVSAYCNDIPCYIASRRILREGGYEADDSMLYYGQPTRLAPETEDRLITAVRGLIPQSFTKAREQAAPGGAAGP